MGLCVVTFKLPKKPKTYNYENLQTICVNGIRNSYLSFFFSQQTAEITHTLTAYRPLRAELFFFEYHICGLVVLLFDSRDIKI